MCSGASAEVGSFFLADYGGIARKVLRTLGDVKAGTTGVPEGYGRKRR